MIMMKIFTFFFFFQVPAQNDDVLDRKINENRWLVFINFFFEKSNELEPIVLDEQFFSELTLKLDRTCIMLDRKST